MRIIRENKLDFTKKRVTALLILVALTFVLCLSVIGLPKILMTHYQQGLVPTKPKFDLSKIPTSKQYLRLIGVDRPVNGNAMAIIEDGFSRKQDIFEIGDWVWNQGKLIHVDKKVVILEVNNKLEKLPMQNIGIIFNSGDEYTFSADEIYRPK